MDRKQKDKLIMDLQAYGEGAVAELVKVFTVQDHKKKDKKLNQNKKPITKDNMKK